MELMTATQELVFVGIKGSVIALRRDSGETAWSIKLRRGASFVPLVVEGDRVYAISGGEVTCLSASDGKPLWHNEMPGFGRGHAVIAGAPSGGAIAAAVSEQEAAARAGSAAAVASTG
jgi:outer membrane protein assembly factor BamB